ncbi:MAG: protein kinase [Deltaproteobacteria bacterium]|jgi:serine/threonine-protein kinase
MKRIGKYEISGLLGRGGMGTVYKARVPVIGRVVALKHLSPHPNLVALLGKETIRRSFVTEAMTMASLRHPHIAAVWDFHDADDLTFFVMEYYCNNLGLTIGETYRVEGASRVLSVDKAIHYTRQILVGLSRLHEAEIIHRDIKPYNILITDEDKIKITDFGLSKLRGETFQGPPNLKVGSPYYAAPEQEDDPDHVDPRADIYPVGVMLYRMLTGALPIEPFRKLSQSNPDLGPDWDAFIDQAIAAEREKRFARAKNMLDSLDALNLAWQEEKEKACQMPQILAPKRTRAQKTKKKLRAQGVKVAPKEARKVFEVDKLWRPIEYMANDLQLNPERTVTDRSNSLLWQQAGSDHPVSWYEAHEYIEQLNHGRFAGRASWRLPTVNELISLITEVPRAADLCVEPIFDQDKRWLWSSDRRSFVAAWYVSLDLGYVSWQDFTCYYFVRAVSSEM